MPRSVNVVAARRRRKKIMLQTRGYFGSRKNVWTVAKKTRMKKVYYMLIEIEKPKKEILEVCGFNVLMPVLVSME